MRERWIGLVLFLIVLLTGCSSIRIDDNIDTPNCMHVSLGTIEEHAEFIELIPMMTYVYENGDLVYTTSFGYKYIQMSDQRIVVIGPNDSTKGYYVETQKEFFDINSDEMIDYIEGKKVTETFWYNRLSYESDDFDFIIYNMENGNFNYYVFPHTGELKNYDIQVKSNSRLECTMDTYSIETEDVDSLYNELDYLELVDSNTLSGQKEDVLIEISLNPLELLVDDGTKSFKFLFDTHQFCLKKDEEYLCDEERYVLNEYRITSDDGIYKREFLDYYTADLYLELYDVMLQYYSMMYDHDYTDID